MRVPGQSVSLIAVIAAGWLYLAAPVHGHGDDDVILAALTAEIERAPDSIWFIRRGELYRHQQQWQKAEEDFVAAGKLTEQPVIHFLRARTLLEAGEPQRAKTLIDLYVEVAPTDPEGWFLRGDIANALGQHEAGDLDYQQGIARATPPRLEFYLRRARYLALAPQPNVDRVLAAIDDGIARLGPVRSLVEFAVNLEKERQNYHGALDRINQIIARTTRPESWFVQRGELFLLLGRPEDARRSYDAALAAIEDLSENTRSTVPIEALERVARAALREIPLRSPK